MGAQRMANGESSRMVSLGFDADLFPAGTHMCYVFNEGEEPRWLTARFMRSGLDANEVVTYLVDSRTPDQPKNAMLESGAILRDELDGGQCHVIEAEKFYCPDGAFQMDHVLNSAVGGYDAAVRSGYSGVRATSEMSWATKGFPGSEDLVEYEARLNLVLHAAPPTAGAVPITVLCQYDARRFDGATLYGILSVHPMMIVRGQVLRNPYYVSPEEFLADRAAGPRA